MADDANDRFLSVSEDDTAAFIDQMKNENTKRKTASDLKLFSAWLLGQNECRAVEDVPPLELDKYMARFFLSVRTQKNEEYEPDSLKSIQSSLCRYMVEKKNINILKDKEFQHSRDVLQAKRKQLKGQGRGNKKQKADPLTGEEINSLYEQNLLGTSNPEALLNTIWLNNILHFGMRGRKEHVDMLFGDVELKTTSQGLQYLEYNERLTKTRQADGSRPFCPKMFATPGKPRCPVNTYKEFIRRRPSDMLTPDSRFYLSLLHRPKQDSEGTKEPWFSRQPLGKNTLGNLCKNMSTKGGLAGRKVNHSGRKTTVTSLLHSKVQATTVMQLTGHKKVTSVNDYSSASLVQQQEMSNILSNIGAGNRGIIEQFPSTTVDIDSNKSNVGAENRQLPTNTMNTGGNDLSNFEFEVEGDNDIANLEFQDVLQVIDQYEAANKNTTDKSATRTSDPIVSSGPQIVKTNMTNSQLLPKYAILQNASIQSLTINIYGADK